LSEGSDRDRALSAYASEVRAFHRFFAVLLLGLAAFHLLVVAPYLRMRADLPVISDKLAAAGAQIKSGEDVQRAAEAAAASLSPFRQALAAGPERLRKSIAEFVARGRAVVGATGDPFRAGVKVPKEGAQPAPEEETITVDEAIRRQIGKEIEFLGMAFDQALESARTIKDIPHDVESILRETRGAVGRDVISLNEILRQAFDADPYFWKRWERPGATFGAASPKADEAMRRIEFGLRGVLKTLATASAQAKTQQQEIAASVEAVRASEVELRERMAKTREVFGRLPLGMDEAARIYPLVAVALALTACVRLRRLLVLRQALGIAAADAAAPSWVIASPESPGRWWSVVLVAAPLLAAVHSAAAAAADPGLFTTTLGDQSRGMHVGFIVGYAVLGVLAALQFAMAARVLLAGAAGATPGG